MSDKRDLTRIEDLSEYLHEVDPEVDRLLDEGSSSPKNTKHDVDDLPPMPNIFSSDYGPEDDDEVSFSQDKTEEIILPEEFSSESDESFDSDFGEELFEESSFDENYNESNFENSSFDSSDVAFSDVDFSSVDEDLEADSFSLQEESPGELSETLIEESDDVEDDNPPFESEVKYASEVEQDDSFVISEVVDQDLFEEVSEPIAPLEKQEYAAPSPGFYQENFSDVKQFAKSVSYGTMTQGGNPPFSIMLRNIKFREDCDDILDILREHGLVNSDSENDIVTGLSHGSLLVSQLSEFSAIFLAHKFRRFDLEVQLGLSDELHPSKNYGRGDSGVIHKGSLLQNRVDSFTKSDSTVDITSVLLATTPSLEGFKIIRYFGLVTEYALIKEYELHNFRFGEEGMDVSQTYSSLAEQLKVKALKKGGNAVLNVNFQFSPLATLKDEEPVYNVTCTGNVVWVIDSGV